MKHTDTNTVIVSGRVTEKPRFVELKNEVYLEFSINSIDDDNETAIAIELSGELAKEYSQHGTRPLAIDDSVLIRGQLFQLGGEVGVGKVDGIWLTEANPTQQIVIN